MPGNLRGLLAIPLIFLISCGPGPATSGGPDTPARPQATAGTKRLLLALISEPPRVQPPHQTHPRRHTTAGHA
jgi:hypothetical protein